MDIGVKYKVDSTDKLVSFLNDEWALTAAEHQVDEYFSPPHRHIEEVLGAPEWLRLRTRDDGENNFIYRKCPSRAGKAGPSAEFRVDVDSSDGFRKLLLALDFSPIGIVDKRRRVWENSEYEVSVDLVAGSGEYVGIVWVGEMRRHSTQWIPEVMEWLKEMDCGVLQRDFRSYFQFAEGVE